MFGYQGFFWPYKTSWGIFPVSLFSGKLCKKLLLFSWVFGRIQLWSHKTVELSLWKDFNYGFNLCCNFFWIFRLFANILHLICWHFGVFLVIFLLLLSSFIVLWLQNIILCIIFILKFLRLALSPNDNLFWCFMCTWKVIQYSCMVCMFFVKLFVIWKSSIFLLIIFIWLLYQLLRKECENLQVYLWICCFLLLILYIFATCYLVHINLNCCSDCLDCCIILFRWLHDSFIHLPVALTIFIIMTSLFISSNITSFKVYLTLYSYSIFLVNVCSLCFFCIFF